MPKSEGDVPSRNREETVRGRQDAGWHGARELTSRSLSGSPVTQRNGWPLLVPEIEKIKGITAHVPATVRRAWKAHRPQADRGR